MTIEYDVAVNLAAGAVGAALVAGASRLRSRVRYHAGRTFWKFLEQPTVFVVGELESAVLLNTLDLELREAVVGDQERKALVERVIAHVGTQEVSGLIGRADYDALVDTVLAFKAFGLPFRHDVLKPNEVGTRRTQNLVLMGGPDVNPLTAVMSRRMGCRLEVVMNGDGRNVVRDRRLDAEYLGDRHPSASSGAQEEVERDYGVLAFGPNPESEGSWVVVMAGAHGWGTWAATQVALEPESLRELLRRMRTARHGLECLVRYERRGASRSEGTVTTTLEWARPLQSRDRRG